MKRITAILYILVFTTTGLIAQNIKTPQLGAKGGVNFATISGDDIEERDSRTSFHAGLVFEIPLGTHFSIQPEALYSGQGFDIREINQDNAFDNDENIEYQIDYLQLPIMAKAYLVKGLYIEGGPQFGIKINEEIDYEPNSNGGDIVIDPDNSYVKDFDTSIALGAGYKFEGGLFLSSRYTHGISTIFKDSTTFQDVDAKNAVWQFGIGFMF